ncbi:hypothetical protein GCM10022291_13270 [Postechiella marina]|uniref:Uncharacterized protein n=1 Tax=Postechiella marina TaxID=943941 RepID=A0ABP8C618_9FLAO
MVLALNIWGVLGYRILSTVNPGTPEIALQDFEGSFIPKQNKMVDTFSIQTVNRDPFLGTLLVKKKATSNKQKQSRKEKVIWMPIIYHGCIVKQKSNAKIYIISINDKQILMKIGQEIDGIKLIRGNSKSVLLEYKQSRKSVLKI